MKRLFPILLLYALFAGCAAAPLLPLVSPFLSGQQPQVSTKAQAIVNVVQQNSSTYFILFGIPRITVRADVVEFTEALPTRGP